MAFISLKWFAGMIPRRGRQHLPKPHATEAENCNLYSGELRPLHKPALAHQFCKPTDDCWRQPLPEDPSHPPEPPPEPPACIPVAQLDNATPCKVYACASYDTAVLAGPNIASFTMTDEQFIDASTSQLIVDKTGNLRDANEVVQQGPFASVGTTIGWCNSYDDYARGNTNTDPYRVYGKDGNASNSNGSQWETDQPWVEGMDDVTVFGIFSMPFCEAASNGTLIGFNGGSYEFSLDVRILCDADGLGDRVRFNWIGGQGGNTPEIHTSAKIPQMVLSDDTPFWFGIHIRRFGTETDCDIDFDVYYSDLVNPIQKVYSETAVPMTTLWHFSRQITYGFDLNCRIQLGEGGTINGADETVYGQRIGVEWGELSADRLDDLSSALDQNKTDYVDPDPNCGLAGLIVSPQVTYPVQANTDLTFTVNVNADATPPVQYQWYQDGIVMSGEVGPSMVLTLQPEDSNTSISVLVQNPCSTQLSDAYLIGEVAPTPFCKVYECDAYAKAIVALNPTINYPMTDGTASLSDGSNPGTVLSDAAGTTDLTWGGPSGFDPFGPDISGLDECVGGTAFQMNQPGTPNYFVADVANLDTIDLGGFTNEGTLVITAARYNDTDPGTMTVYWEGGRNVSIVFLSSNQAIFQNTAGSGNIYNSGPITVPANSDGGHTLILRFNSVLTECYADWDRTNLLASGVMIGAPNNGDVAERRVNLGTGVRQQNCFWINRRVTDVEMDTMKAAMAQNLITYVDPDPNCTPLP